MKTYDYTETNTWPGEHYKRTVAHMRYVGRVQPQARRGDMEQELKEALDTIDAYIDEVDEDVQGALNRVRSEIVADENLIRYYRGELANKTRVREGK